MDEEKVTFSFGRNWNEFIQTCFSDERVAIVKAHLLDFLEMESLDGRYFLDVGCGSGIHSLAALQAGAGEVVSFDIDSFSCKAASTIRERQNGVSNWEILEGSVLDGAFLSRISPADIVYSWGVLHHTGDMWTAIRNAAGLMKPEGLFYIALYTTTPASGYWLEMKKQYNRASSFGKRLMEYRYVLRHLLLPEIIGRRNPLKRFQQYKKNRGMSCMTDVRDWLGGYPYEDARIEEVHKFCRKELGMELINLRTGEANTEYLFKMRQDG